jgi:hypothetical protein
MEYVLFTVSLLGGMSGWLFLILWRVEAAHSQELQLRLNEATELETALRKSIDTMRDDVQELVDSRNAYKSLFERYQSRAELAEGKLYDIGKIANGEQAT